jgi:two-component sensor histidine kinase
MHCAASPGPGASPTCDGVHLTFDEIARQSRDLTGIARRLDFKFYVPPLSAASSWPTPQRLMHSRKLMSSLPSRSRQPGFSVERMRTEEAKELLLNESKHRIKNTLATVQAIAGQTRMVASHSSVCSDIGLILCSLT